MATIRVRKYLNKTGSYTYRYRGKAGELTEIDVASFKEVEFKYAKSMAKKDIDKVIEKFKESKIKERK